MMYIVECEGCHIVVPSLAGYEDCPVIESNVPEPPGDWQWYERVDGEWVEKVAEREAAEEAARLGALTPAELQAEAVEKAKVELAAALGITLP
jgi:hypothetical protein